MFYSKHPFLKVGLPFLTAMVFGTLLLGDIRKSRYEHQKVRTSIKNDNDDSEEPNEPTRKNIKTLEEELKEWEEKHRKKIEEAKSDYEMKPVR